jgi:ribosome-binding protein aMBF1 (putative translation factor)
MVNRMEETSSQPPLPGPARPAAGRRGRPLAWGSRHGELIRRVLELKAAGLSLRGIAAQVGVSKSTVASLIKGRQMPSEKS